MNDEWRPVPGYEGLYAVNRRGLVLSLARSVKRGRGQSVIGATMMTPSRDRGGYERISLSRDGRKQQFGVHQLVCCAFIGPRPVGMEVAHLNGDPADNRAENLAWRTPRDNSADKVVHGTHQVGERHPRAKLTADAVVQIRSRLAAGEGVVALAAAFGVHQSTISDIKSGKRWREAMPARAGGIAQPPAPQPSGAHK